MLFTFFVFPSGSTLTTYKRIIVQILREAGSKGMPLRRIALNVFNMTNTFFEPQDKDEVYTTVGNLLRNWSLKSGSLIERAETRGWYRLNFKSKQVQQLLLEFQADKDTESLL